MLDTPQKHDDEIFSCLATSSGATVVRVNYRCGRDYPYPLPIHDTLACYDWVLENIIPSISWTSRHGRNHTQAKLGVCGELVGGSLATMLALTESKLGATRISAAAVNCPIVDWVFPTDGVNLAARHELSDDDLEYGWPDLEKLSLQEEARHHSRSQISSRERDEHLDEPDDPHTEPYLDASEERYDLSVVMPNDDILEPGDHAQGTSPMQGPSLKDKLRREPTSWEVHKDNIELPASALVRARNLLFRKTEAYLDRFASPICFFRTSGIELPPPFSYLYDLTFESPEERPDMDSPEYATPPTMTAVRKYHRIFPQIGTGLRIPDFRITRGTDNVLFDQNAELARLMRRSIERDVKAQLSNVHEESEWARDDTAHKEAQRRIELVTTPGTGLWSLRKDNHWLERVQQVGQWFQRQL